MHQHPAEAFLRWLLGKERLRWIGTLAAEWQTLDEVVELVLWSQLQVRPNQRAPITTHIRIKERMDILRALAHVNRDDERLDEELKSIWETISNLQTRRNNVIHARWNWTDAERKSVRAVKIAARGPLKVTLGDAGIPAIKKLLKDILKVKIRLLGCLDWKSQKP